MGRSWRIKCINENCGGEEGDCPVHTSELTPSVAPISKSNTAAYPCSTASYGGVADCDADGEPIEMYAS